ncbi:large conductance mechanosensitive channel protein MscL [Cellulomonas sp. CW35]|uniref:large conductance mechanosensitive channel protein MscL n=1 Tax=Cellulomonas sp. CW35 TaxID=3458249 RepID=UPI00227E21E7
MSQSTFGSTAGSAANALGSGAKGLGKVFEGFKDFISRGNAVDLAVGVVIGAAFGALVSSIVENVINPLIGWIFGQPNLDNIWTIGPYSWGNEQAQPILMGKVLTALITFLLTAAAVYFLVVLPLNALAARRKRGEEAEPAAPAEDILLLQEIRDLLAQRPTPALQSDLTTPPTIRPEDGPTPPAPTV